MRKILTTPMLIAFFGLVAYLLIKSANNGATEYAKIEKLVRSIDQSNTELDSAVLSLRLGLVLDYDELTRCEQQLAALELVDSELTENSPLEAQLRSTLGELIHQKTLLSADFKASHSVVRNAMSGFRRHTAKALHEISLVSSKDANRVSILEIMGTRFVVTGNLEDKANFEAAIKQVERLASIKELRETLGRTLAHAAKLVEHRIELDRTIETLVAVPIRQKALDFLDQASASHEVESRFASRYRACLAIAVAFLIGFCIYQYVVLFKHKAALFESNASLERRVRERTEELANTNQDLEYAIAEAKKLALVARYTDNAVVITDARATIEWVNDGFTRITGFTIEEVIGKSFIEYLRGPDSESDKLHEMQSALEAKQGFDVETVNYRKSGEPYWVEIETRPIINRNGEVTRFIAIESDITERVNNELERQQLNEQLVDASRTAGMAEVATGVLHDVGNILNSVNVSTNLIRGHFRKSALSSLEKLTGLIGEHENDFGSFVRDDKRGQKIPNYITRVTGVLRQEHETITSEFKDLVDNVEHIKEIVSVQQSMAKSSGVRQQLSATDLVNDSITANKGTLANHHVKISQEIEASLPELVSDKHKILQILINLIKNAKDAMVENDTPDPEIKIRAWHDEGFVVFSVIDNGIGIPAEQIAKIFNHGFTTKKTGHGFGLHSSANAATEIGGTLSVASEGVGKGAAFHLKLPVDYQQSMVPVAN